MKDQFWYIKIQDTWLGRTRNVLFIPEPQGDFFCFISQASVSPHWLPEVISRVGRGASSNEKPLSPRVQRAKNERFNSSLNQVAWKTLKYVMLSWEIDPCFSSYPRIILPLVSPVYYWAQTRIQTFKKVFCLVSYRRSRLARWNSISFAQTQSTDKFPSNCTSEQKTDKLEIKTRKIPKNNESISYRRIKTQLIMESFLKDAFFSWCQ